MAGAQFIGKEKLLAAFERRGGGTWQIAQGKKVCAKGSGSDELSEWIDIFTPANSRAPYTLHLFSDLEPEEIGKHTPDASWDFMMSDGTGGAVGSTSGTAGVVSKLQQKIDDRIADKLGAMLDKADEPDEGEGGIDLNAIINDYAANPHKVGQAVGAIQQLVGMFKSLLGGNAAAPQPMGAVGGLPGSRQQPQQETYPDGTYERLCAVLDNLQKRDPKLLQHLEKLNTLDDVTFSIILSRLDAL